MGGQRSHPLVLGVTEVLWTLGGEKFFNKSVCQLQQQRLRLILILALDDHNIFKSLAFPSKTTSLCLAPASQRYRWPTPASTLSYSLHGSFSWSLAKVINSRDTETYTKMVWMNTLRAMMHAFKRNCTQTHASSNEIQFMIISVFWQTIVQHNPSSLYSVAQFYDSYHCCRWKTGCKDAQPNSSPGSLTKALRSHFPLWQHIKFNSLLSCTSLGKCVEVLRFLHLRESVNGCFLISSLIT